MPQGYAFLLAAGGSMVGLCLITIGVALLRDCLRVRSDGIPMLGTVIEVDTRGDHDSTMVEYSIGDRIHRCWIQNYTGAVGATVALLVDPKAHDRAFLKDQMRGRGCFFGCLIAFGLLCCFAGGIGTVLFVAARMSR